MPPPACGMAAGPSHVAGPGPRPGTRPQSQQTGYSERYTLLVGGRATHTTHDRTHERHQKGIRKRHACGSESGPKIGPTRVLKIGARSGAAATRARSWFVRSRSRRSDLGCRLSVTTACAVHGNMPTRTARSLIAKRTERQSPGTALSQQTGNSTHHVQPRPTPIVPYPRTGRGRLVRCWT